MDSSFPVFKDWVPRWLAKIILFSVFLPSLVLFFLPLSNINAAAGYYGSEPADIQFAVALFYAGYVGFYCLERRFFSYLAAKEYFIVFTFLQMLTAFLCYETQSLYVLFPVRFLQGMLFASTVNLSLSLMFARLKKERSREIAYSVFFGMLLCTMPFNNFVTADLIDAFNFNIVYKSAVFSYIPGLVLILISMNNIRLNVRFPLYKLDWQSFSMYSAALCLLGYVLVFGQEYYWLEDLRVRNSVVTIAVLVLIFVLRQRSMKRPYLDLQIFRFRNFKAGILLLFLMYLCRFASGITNSFFAEVLKFDPQHVSYMNLWNITGLVTGVVVSCCLTLQQRPIRYSWLPGFLFLMLFHSIMFFLFDTQANEDVFFIPLLLQGMGVGMIMVPTIIYIISSVPVHMAPSAAAAGLAIRYLGFVASIAVMNYFELYERGYHFNVFREHITAVDFAVKKAIAVHAHKMQASGVSKTPSVKMAQKLLVGAANNQTRIRFAMDYYEAMAFLMLATMILIILFPYLNRTSVYLRARRLSPA